MRERKDHMGASIYRRYGGGEWDDVSSTKVRHEQKRNSE